MPRANSSVPRHRRHRKLIKQAKGYFGTRKSNYRTAKDAVQRGWQYAYRDRRQKKRNFRRLWIIRINAAVRQHEMSYSKFIAGLKIIYPKAILNGNKQNKLPGLISVSFPGFRSDILMAKLDRLGIYVSNGAACGSGDIKPSTVLKAISLSTELNISTLPTFIIGESKFSSR